MVNQQYTVESTISQAKGKQAVILPDSELFLIFIVKKRWLPTDAINRSDKMFMKNTCIIAKCLFSYSLVVSGILVHI